MQVAHVLSNIYKELMPRRGVIAAVTFKPRKASTGRLPSPLKTKSSRY